MKARTMARIGILTCSNTTQDIGCSVFGCLEGMYKKTDSFARYGEGEDVVLAGMINCAGCPTAVGYEKLLNRVRTLADLGVDAIHFSSCVVIICPFAKKYAKLIGEHWPEIDVVMGTHDAPVEPEQMIAVLKERITAPSENMVDIGARLVELG